MKRRFFHFLLLSASFAFFSCNGPETESKSVKVPEVYQTQRNEQDNIDSPTIWHGPDNQHWLIATAKEGNVLVVHDARNGRFLQRFGELGSGPGQFSRPNGVFVIDDLVLVVERDNHRIQVLHLPDFNHIGFIGDSLLIKPYGLYVYKIDHKYSMYVTDNYETEDEQVPPNQDLGRRIHQYEFSIENNQLYWTLARRFGETEGKGVLRIVESLWGDVDNNRLLIAEEDETQSSVKVYDLEGRFTNMVFGRSIFEHQVEGIALYAINGDQGHWIIADQSHTDNQFHIFARTSFEYVTTFKGPKTTNTDGIWLTTQSFGDFEQGAFFAVHNDGNVSAFDWGEVMESTGIAK